MTNSPAYARIVSAITNRDEPETMLAVRQWEAARKTIPGWSLPAHSLFFRAVVDTLAPARGLVCGVYHGLDLALIQAAAACKRKRMDLTGVDLFSAGPCADWTPEQRARGTWEANDFGPSPSIEAAQRNAPGAALVKSSSVDFMRDCAIQFDFIYLDTSHDYETVKAEIIAAKRILAPGGVLAGDDYYTPGAGWGVDKAVCELLPHHVALWNRIWLAT